MNGITQFFPTLSSYLNSYVENQFPVNLFDFLRQHGLLNTDLPGRLNIDKPLNDSLVKLLKVLGRKNLSAGRIFGGHLNAIQSIKSFANPMQIAKWLKI